MKTFQEFMTVCEATYDKEVMSGSQIKTIGTGGRVSPERKKTAPERRKMRTTMGPEGKLIRVPSDYKPRKDIGTQRQTSTRVQQPTQERGSADVKAKAAAAAKEERKKAALARIAAKKKGESATTEKPKAKEVEKQASQLLSKKAPDKKPEATGKTDNMIRGIYLPKGEKRPYSRAERVGIERAASALRRDMLKGKERPASAYSAILKPGKLHASERK